MKTLMMGALAAPFLGFTLSLAAPAANAAPLRAQAAHVEQAGQALLVRHMGRGHHYGWDRGRHRGHHRRYR